MTSAHGGIQANGLRIVVSAHSNQCSATAAGQPPAFASAATKQNCKARVLVCSILLHRPHAAEP
jgi:hypothetical protein